MIPTPLQLTKLAGKIATAVVIMLYGTILLLLPLNADSRISAFVMFSGFIALFLWPFIKLDDPWWAGIPFVLCLILECVLLSTVLFDLCTDPLYRPFWEILPFAYWIFAGLGLGISSVIVSVGSFKKGYKSGRDRTSASSQ